MNFTKFDISILVTMSLAVIIMSFAFPALGLSDENSVNESDIPEFNMSASTFDFTGDFPRQPNAADSGTIRYDEQTGNSIEGVTVIFVDRPVSDGASVELQNTSANGMDFVFTNYSSAGDTLARSNINAGDEGQTTIIESDGWTISYTVEHIQNYNTPDMTVEVSYQVENAPEDTKGLSAIPIIGGVTDQIAQYVGWIGTIFFWGSLWLVELVTNILSIIVSVVAYLFGMTYWLVSTYNAIVSSASSWAAVVLVVPAVLLFAEFAKIAALVIKMLPTT